MADVSRLTEKHLRVQLLDVCLGTGDLETELYAAFKEEKTPEQGCVIAAQSASGVTFEMVVKIANDLGVEL